MVSFFYSNLIFICRSLIFALSIVNIDDCWQSSRDSEGKIEADKRTFPSGIPALIDYVHSKNLKFGLYSGKIILVPLKSEQPSL